MQDCDRSSVASIVTEVAWEPCACSSAACTWTASLLAL
jgi:hypothetical protein